MQYSTQVLKFLASPFCTQINLSIKKKGIIHSHRDLNSVSSCTDWTNLKVERFVQWGVNKPKGLKVCSVRAHTLKRLQSGAPLVYVPLVKLLSDSYNSTLRLQSGAPLVYVPFIKLLNASYTSTLRLRNGAPRVRKPPHAAPRAPRVRA
jgi:hypothetical protein